MTSLGLGLVAVDQTGCTAAISTSRADALWVRVGIPVACPAGRAFSAGPTAWAYVRGEVRVAGCQEPPPATECVAVCAPVVGAGVAGSGTPVRCCMVQGPLLRKTQSRSTSRGVETGFTKPSNWARRSLMLPSGIPDTVRYCNKLASRCRPFVVASPSGRNLVIPAGVPVAGSSFVEGGGGRVGGGGSSGTILRTGE